MVVCTISQTLEASKTLYNVYAKSFILEEKLFSAEMKAALSNKYGKIQSAFVNFRNILKKVSNKKSI